ncbi:MAG TPA: hypothetical protein VH374_22915 [Polyangia bacterium]|nr:hypothetical protein [Polyangia bacterium]
MEQNRKPGASKDISDLKARLGLKRPEAPATGPAVPNAGIPAPGFPAQGGNPPMAGMQTGMHTMMGRQGSAAASAPMAAPAMASAPPAGMDPYARMKASAGGFDLRTIDDGQPAVNVRSGRGKAVLITGVIVGLAAFALGAGYGIASVGRANMNTANHAAQTVKGELEGMQKTLTQIGTAVAMSQQRLAAAKKDTLAYDPQLIADLEKIKLDPRPDTGKIFRVDYFRLDDVVVDRLFNYYYDSIALYGEAERHIKRTKADAESLATYGEKTAAAAAKNYGMVFDTGSKIIVGNLVEIGEQVCKGGGSECQADNLEGFKVRSNTGAPWVVRKAGGKLDAEKVIPLRPTPLMDAAMTGSTEQVRYEAYKQRTANMRAIVARLTASQKELFEGINKAASRPDVFTIF